MRLENSGKNNGMGFLKRPMAFLFPSSPLKIFHWSLAASTYSVALGSCDADLDHIAAG